MNSTPWHQVCQIRSQMARKMSLLKRQVPRPLTLQDLARQLERR